MGRIHHCNNFFTNDFLTLFSFKITILCAIVTSLGSVFLCLLSNTDDHAMETVDSVLSVRNNLEFYWKKRM